MILALFLDNMGFFEYNIKVRFLQAEDYMTEKNRHGKNHMTGSGFPMGAVLTHQGVQFSTCIDFRKTLELIMFDASGNAIDHVNMTDHRTDAGSYSARFHSAWKPVCPSSGTRSWRSLRR